MKRFHISMPSVVLFGLLIVGAVSCGRAQGRFGIGFVLGQPTGFDWKYRISSANALDGSIGFTGSDRTRVNVDYLWQSHPFEEYGLALHYGIGAAMGFGNESRENFFHENDVGFGVRGVVGLNYMVRNSPVDIFMEVAPVMVFSTPTGMSLDAGFGVRFYP